MQEAHKACAYPAESRGQRGRKRKEPYMKQIIAVVLASAMLAGTGLAETKGTGADIRMDALGAPGAVSQAREAAEKDLWAGTETQLTETDIQLYSGGNAKMHAWDGRVIFVDGSCAAGPVRDAEAAHAVARSMLRLLGGTPRTQLEPWRDITDPAGNRYFIFQQMQGDTTVLGGAVKIITDAAGRMMGLTSSLITDLPEAAPAARLTAAEAEALVLKHEEGKAGVSLVSGETRQIILPVTLELDPNASEIDENSRLVWAVYTTNPDIETHLPYLAHYVAMAGEYLYSMPAVLPGDRASSAGFPADYVFQFMEPVDYTGYVDLSDGTEKAVTVSLMRDTRTGTYYLGNIERRIAVADCWEFLYNGGRVALASSEDNREWEQTALLSLYNYCRAYDYYREIGWIGGDGLGTPMLILNNFCDADHQPIDNAAYAGQYCGWQLFLSSRANDMAQCLDVLAHEFTHCVTQSAMTYSYYMNDQGAINEALSDIQGNLCEMMSGATEDRNWNIGENGRQTVRSMSNPHRYGQPEYAWDLYYDENVLTPTAMNDRGGVHTNSSLLSRVAWSLCEQGGMSLQEARTFWFAVACAMTPDTDYIMMADLLPWVLRSTGLSAYAATLSETLETTRMAEHAAPETLRAHQSLLTLELPDNELFTDGNWSLGVLTLDTDTLMQRIAAMGLKLAIGDTEGMPKLLVELASVMKANAEKPAEPFSLTGLLTDLLFGEPAAEKSTLPLDPESPEFAAQRDEMLQWLTEQFRGILYSDTAAAGLDGRTVQMVCTPGRSIPYLLYLTLEDNSDQIKQMNFLVWIHDRWVDLTGIAAALGGESDENPFSALMESGLVSALANAFLASEGLKDLPKTLTLKIPADTAVALPSAGLEQVDLSKNMAATVPPVMEEEERPVAMSRPV